MLAVLLTLLACVQSAGQGDFPIPLVFGPTAGCFGPHIPGLCLRRSHVSRTPSFSARRQAVLGRMFPGSPCTAPMSVGSLRGAELGAGVAAVSAVRPAVVSPAERLGIRALHAARTQVLAEEGDDEDEDFGDEDDGEADMGKVNELLPADCMSVQEIGAVGGFFMVLTWIVLVVTAIFMAIKAYQAGPEVQVQKYYYLNAFLCAVASYSYFAMFSGMGWETIEGCRQYFYVRFIELGVSMSITIFSLGLLAGQDTPTVLAVMGSGVGSVHALYMGGIALVPLSKFLWFLFALALFAPVVFALLREFRQTVTPPLFTPPDLQFPSPDAAVLYRPAALNLRSPQARTVRLIHSREICITQPHGARPVHQMLLEVYTIAETIDGGQGPRKSRNVHRQGQLATPNETLWLVPYFDRPSSKYSYHPTPVTGVRRS